MSYILDALEKSEKKRRTGTVPDLQTVHAQVFPGVRKIPWWQYAVTGLLVVQAVVVLVWLTSGEKEDAPDPVASHEQASVGASPVADKPAPAPVQERVSVTVPQEESKAQILPPAEHGSAVSVQEGSTVAVPAEPPPLPAVEQVVENSEGLAAVSISSIMPDETMPAREVLLEPEPVIERGRDEEIPDISQLPASARENLPDLSISYHAFSHNPAARLVSINGRMVRQGQTVDKGLVLEEITSAGVILRNNEHRFRLKVF